MSGLVSLDPPKLQHACTGFGHPDQGSPHVTDLQRHVAWSTVKVTKCSAFQTSQLSQPLQNLQKKKFGFPGWETLSSLGWEMLSFGAPAHRAGMSNCGWNFWARA